MTRYRVPGLVRFVLGHPRYAPVLIRAFWRLRRDGWWHRYPFLPVPYRPYWDFRMVTANGSSGAGLTVREAVDVAMWSLRQPVGR